MIDFEKEVESVLNRNAGMGWLGKHRFFSRLYVFRIWTPCSAYWGLFPDYSKQRRNKGRNTGCASFVSSSCTLDKNPRFFTVINAKPSIADLMFFELGIQRTAADAESAGSFRLVSLAGGKRFGQKFFFVGFKCGIIALCRFFRKTGWWYVL